jgi:hypothetical protein
MVTLSTASAVPTVEDQQNFGGARKSAYKSTWLPAQALPCVKKSQRAEGQGRDTATDARTRACRKRMSLVDENHGRGECTHRRILCNGDMGERNTHVGLPKDESEGEISGLSTLSARAPPRYTCSQTLQSSELSLLVRSCFKMSLGQKGRERPRGLNVRRPPPRVRRTQQRPSGIRISLAVPCADAIPRSIRNSERRNVVACTSQAAGRERA